MADHDQSVFHVTSLGVTARLFLAPHFRRLRHAGLSVTLVCSDDAETRRWCGEVGVAFQAVPIRQNISPISDLRATAHLWTLLKRERPRVVHTHMSKAGLIGLLAARLAGVPIRIYHNHGMAMLGSSGLRRLMLRTVEWANSRLATHVLFCGASTRDAALQYGVTTAERATVLGEGSIAGIDVERFSPGFGRKSRDEQRREWDVPEDRVVAGFVGRLVPHKGIALLLQAWRLLPEDVRNSAVLVLIGGLGDAGLTEQVRAAERDGIGVRYPGWSADMASCYAAFDLLVLPSFYEGLPYSALEAQSMELPVICTAVTGNVDAVVDGETGVHVPPGDAAALSAAIASLVRSPERRADLGRRGRARVVRDFRQERVVQQMLEFYEAAGVRTAPQHN